MCRHVFTEAEVDMMLSARKLVELNGGEIVLDSQYTHQWHRVVSALRFILGKGYLKQVFCSQISEVKHAIHKASGIPGFYPYLA